MGGTIAAGFEQESGEPAKGCAGSRRFVHFDGFGRELLRYGHSIRPHLPPLRRYPDAGALRAPGHAIVSWSSKSADTFTGNSSARWP